jgi:DNA-binding NarL/FixJ family response regulator
VVPRGEEQASGRPIRVVIVDDSKPLLDTLVTALGWQPGIDVVATAADGDQAVTTVLDAQPDVVLLDLRLGDTWGLDLVPALRAGPNPPAIVVFSAAADAATLDAVSLADVRARVSKGASAEEIAAVLLAAGTPDRDAGAQS